MSADHESSYYEIALTNRQVLTIFVVLLTCLVAAFLSGVWIGRGSDGEVAPLEASLGEPVEEPAKAQVTELNFFSEGASRDRPKAPVEPREAPAKPPPAVEEPPPVVAKSEPLESKPPASPAPATAAPASPAPATPAPAAAGAGRVIQVFSTLDAAQADRLVRRLGEGGYPAFLVEENLQGRTTYRVRVGPYQQEARAQKIADELRRDYRLETWITSQAG